MAILDGSYVLKHNYLSDAVDTLAKERIMTILGGFPGVEISVHGREARVIFTDREECLFAFQRHYKIDIVPGEVEWRFIMKDAAQEPEHAL